MSSNSTETWPVYLTLGIYFAASIAVTLVANSQNRAEEAKASANGGDEVSTHFLGGKGMSYGVLTMTTFASIFSGYTVVGVPNSAAANGFYEFRWLGIITGICIGAAFLNPRLRRISSVRNYLSPGDFFMDRYDSVPLKFLTSLSLCLPQVLYLAVQFHSLAALVVALTNGELNFNVIIYVSVFILLALEALGGMRSVAYTDTVQGCIMICVFVLVPVIIGFSYGMFGGQTANGNELCSAAVETNVSLLKPGMGCINVGDGRWSNNGTAVLPNNWIRTPSTISTVNFLIFLLGFFPFAMNPHMMQRVLSGKSDKVLKYVMSMQWFMGMFANFGVILIGITILSRRATLPPGLQQQGGFFAFLNLWRNDANVFLNLLSYVLILAAVAGILSTADSALIGVSNTISVDLFKNWFRPAATAKETIYFGKFVSLITALSAAILASVLEANKEPGSQVSYATIFNLQNGILWQAYPAFVLGLFTNISRRSALRGLATGLVASLILIVVEEAAKADVTGAHQSIWTMMHEDGQSLEAGINGLVGAFVNTVVCLIGYMVDPPDEAEENGGPKLSYMKIKSIMSGVVEPATYRGGSILLISLVLYLTSIIGCADTIDPSVAHLEGISRYLYN